MSRTFTIEAVYQQGKRLRITGGRYKSSSASSAASKAFSQVIRKKGILGRVTLEIHMRETTQGSMKKIFKYKVSRVNNSTEQVINGETIIFKYTTKVRSI